MSRAEYESRALSRRQEVPRLRAEGFSGRQIAARLGIGERRVKQLLKEHREGEPGTGNNGRGHRNIHPIN